MKVLIAAEDAGGANSVSPVADMLKNNGAEIRMFAAGPAKGIFAAKNTAYIGSGTFYDEKPDVVLVGTSAGESIEKKITTFFKGKVPIIAVLDYWSNYWQRFSKLGEKDFFYLPDLICVMDEIAKEEMLREGFDPALIVVTGNPYFDHFADGVDREKEERERILFISQALREIAALPGFEKAIYDEYYVVETLIRALGLLPKQYYLSIRLHPKDSADKYKNHVRGRVKIAEENSVEDALSRSGLIIGMSSVVLLQAAAAGKKVLSYRPGLTDFNSDNMVGNRVHVTTRITVEKELIKATEAYAQGKWFFNVKPFREVWPAGASERVVGEIMKYEKNNWRV